jgi:hypothetical protein
MATRARPQCRAEVDNAKGRANPANGFMNLLDKSDGAARIALCDLIGYFFHIAFHAA